MIEFLSALFPAIGFGKEYVELRMLDPQGREHAMQDWLDNLNKVEDAALAEAQFRDVYFGILPRVILKGGAEAIEDYTSVLWADYDPKVLSKSGLFAAITGLSPKPQIVVDSGSGYHVYWLLDRSYPFEVAQNVMKDIARATGGDHVADKARILRLPGTLNHKTNPPKPVRLLRLDLLAPKHRLSDFYAYDRESVSDFTRGISFEDLMGPPMRQVKYFSKGTPQWLLDLITDDPGKGKRSEHVFHVVAALVELGYPDDEIEEIIRDNPRGVGAKYAEKGAYGHKYLSYPLTEARRRQNG